MVQSVQIGLLGLSEATCSAPLRGPIRILRQSLYALRRISLFFRHFATRSLVRQATTISLFIWGMRPSHNSALERYYLGNHTAQACFGLSASFRPAVVSLAA